MSIKVKRPELKSKITLNSKNTSLIQEDMERLNQSKQKKLSCNQGKSSEFLISYSTAPGGNSSDGYGRNGLYTEALIKELNNSDLPIDRLLNSVSNYVKERSTENQIPWSKTAINSQCIYELNFKDLLSKYKQKTALVIGNSDYKSNPLKNPINDSTDIAKYLKTQGFRVFQKNNITSKEFSNILSELKKQISKDSLFIFYYSGFGVNINDVNYLIPIDAELINETDLIDKGMSFNNLLGTVKLKNPQLSIYFLDTSFEDAFRAMTITR